MKQLILILITVVVLKFSYKSDINITMKEKYGDIWKYKNILCVLEDDGSFVLTDKHGLVGKFPRANWAIVELGNEDTTKTK